MPQTCAIFSCTSTFSSVGLHELCVQSAEQQERGMGKDGAGCVAAGPSWWGARWWGYERAEEAHRRVPVRVLQVAARLQVRRGLRGARIVLRVDLSPLFLLLWSPSLLLSAPTAAIA